MHHEFIRVTGHDSEDYSRFLVGRYYRGIQHIYIGIVIGDDEMMVGLATISIGICVSILLHTTVVYLVPN